MKEEINVLIKEDEIVARVKELAEQINRDYEGKTLHLICILKGSVFFTCELAKYITVPVTCIKLWKWYDQQRKYYD